MTKIKDQRSAEFITPFEGFYKAYTELIDLAKSLDRENIELKRQIKELKYQIDYLLKT